jgi:transcriptional regulator of NAD metabolism
VWIGEGSVDIPDFERGYMWRKVFLNFSHYEIAEVVRREKRNPPQ